MVASGNALKTGVYSRMVVLLAEDPAKLEVLQRHFIEDFQPVGIVEEAIVWKNLCLDKIEHNLFEEILNKVVTCDELRDVNFYVYSGLSWVLEYQEMFDGLDIGVFQQSLQYLLDLDGRAPTVEDIETLKSEYPTAYDELESLAKQYGYGAASPDIFCGLQISHGGDPKVSLVKQVIQSEITYARRLIGLYERRPKLDAAVVPALRQIGCWGLLRSHLVPGFINYSPSCVNKKTGFEKSCN